MSRASQIDGANGIIRSGMRVQRQSTEDGRWYCGMAHDIFADGTVAIELDNGEYCTCESEDVHVLLPSHPGFPFVRDATTGRTPLHIIERSFASSSGLDGDSIAAGVGSPTDSRARKQRSATNHPPAVQSGMSMQSEAASNVAATAWSQPAGGFTFGAPPPESSGGFNFSGNPPAASSGGFNFGAAPAGGGFTFGS